MKALRVRRLSGEGVAAEAMQHLEVPEASSPTNEFLIQAVDINFDEVLDLAFGPLLRTRNLELSYWLVEEATGELRGVGRLSNLKLRADAQQLETTEVGGHAGLLFKKGVYRWAGGTLEPVSTIEQTQSARAGYYQKATRSFLGGSLVKEAIEEVRAP